MSRYWFKARSHGYGAVPVTWQGWLTVAVFVIVMTGLWFVIVPSGASSDVPWTALALWLTAVAILTTGFLAFCRSRTEGEWRWRWGEKN